MKRHTLTLLAAVLAGSLALTACGAASESAGTSADSYVESDIADNAVADKSSVNEDPSLSWDSASLAATDAGAQDTGETEGEAVTDDATGQKLVVTLNYSVETKDLDALDESILAETKKLGGYVESSSKDGNHEGDDSWYARYATYTLRIPSEKLDEFATALEGESSVTSKSTDTQDITLQYIDTDSRKTALETEKKRLEEMLKKAESVDDLIQIENALTDVRSELQELETTLRHYDNQVSYSTVNISVTETKEYTAVTESRTPAERIQEGFASSVQELRDHVENLAVDLASNAPMILYYLVLAIIVILLIRLVVAILVAIFASREWKEKRRAKKKARKQAREKKKEDQAREKLLEKEEEKKLLQEDRKKSSK
ncbi:MAG: DUF4349 domain-containing protein [Lachnospiraceae bacterium]